MGKKSKFHIIIDVLSYIVLILAVAGLVTGAIGLYKIIPALQNIGLIVLISGFVLFILKYPILSAHKRKCEAAARVVIDVLSGKYHLAIDELPANLTKRELKIATKKRRKFIEKQIKYQNKTTATNEKNARKKVKIVGMQAIVEKRKKEKKEIHFCDNCGTAMRQNIREEWKCPICDAHVDIDLSALLESTFKVKLKKAEEKAAARLAQKEEDEKEEAALRKLRESAEPINSEPIVAAEVTAPLQVQQTSKEDTHAKIAEEKLRKATQKEMEARLEHERKRLIDEAKQQEEGKGAKETVRDVRATLIVEELEPVDNDVLHITPVNNSTGQDEPAAQEVQAVISNSTSEDEPAAQEVQAVISNGKVKEKPKTSLPVTHSNEEFDWDNTEESADSFEKPSFVSKENATDKTSSTIKDDIENDMEEIIQRASKKVLNSLIASITGAVSENVSDMFKEQLQKTKSDKNPKKKSSNDENEDE